MLYLVSDLDLLLISVLLAEGSFSGGDLILLCSRRPVRPNRLRGDTMLIEVLDWLQGLGMFSDVLLLVSSEEESPSFV